MFTILNTDQYRSQVFIVSAGPFSKRGTYRLRVVLYDGFQPLMAGVDTIVGASTARRQATEKEGTLVGQNAIHFSS